MVKLLDPIKAKFDPVRQDSINMMLIEIKRGYGLKIDIFTYRCMLARLELHEWLSNEFKRSDVGYVYVRKLLGIPAHVDLTSSGSMTEEHIRLCNLITGPHGKAIYKALPIQRGLDGTDK